MVLTCYIRGYLSDGCVHDMAHLVPILGRFKSVSAFANSTQKIHVCEDTLATTIRLENGSIGVANFTFVSHQHYRNLKS